MTRRKNWRTTLETDRNVQTTEILLALFLSTNMRLQSTCCRSESAGRRRARRRTDLSSCQWNIESINSQVRIASMEEHLCTSGRQIIIIEHRQWQVHCSTNKKQANTSLFFIMRSSISYWPQHHGCVCDNNILNTRNRLSTRVHCNSYAHCA